MSLIVGTFNDRRGMERIEIHTDGRSLATIIRGVEFTGGDFDSLSPAVETDQFDLQHEYLCGCELNVRIPIRLTAPSGLRHVKLDAQIILGVPKPLGGLDAVNVRLQLNQPEFTLHSAGKSGHFEDEMLFLATQLPEEFKIQTCVTCGFSDYSPAGSGCFGSLACFRDVPDQYRKVESKSDIFALWDRLTEYVQETHYCSKFEQRVAGTGYRG